MVDRLGNAKVFGKIDLKSRYSQILLKLGDVKETTFKKQWGLLEYLVTLTNVPRNS